MAIQIDEKLLSNEAKQFLSNTKNKSQLLREALEVYIRNFKGGMESTECNLNEDVIKDIKDIKQMMLQMANGYKPVIISETSVDMQVKEIQSQESIKKIKNINIQPELIKTVKDQPEVINNEEKKDSLNIADEMTEEQKREIEKLLDNSLDNFI